MPSAALKPRPPGLDSPLVPKIMRFMSRAHVWVYRTSGGRLGKYWRVGSAFRKPVPVLLLTTVGSKTGLRRTTPLLYLEDGGKVAIVASQGGQPVHPAWYKNLRANPEVEVQIGTQVRKLRARDATAEERAAWWPRLVEHYADFASYQSWTDRVIPVVLLE